MTKVTTACPKMLRHSVIDSGLAIVIAMHPPPDTGVEEPLHQVIAADAERVLEILVRPGTVPVD